MVVGGRFTDNKYAFLPSSELDKESVLQHRQVAPTPKQPGKKLLIILHGKRIDDEFVREAIEQIRAEGHEAHVRVTWDSGDVDNFVREAVELWDSQSYDTLVAGGGDGTLNELVAALLQHDAPKHISIAQLPLGTANDLASATGISLHPVDALRVALDPDNIHPIDIALVNGEVFMNLTTAGPVSEVSSKAMSDTLKKALGPAAVAVAGFRQLFITGLQPIKDVKITYPKTLDTKHDNYQPDQVDHIQGDLLVLAAGQARQMGRMINVCPDALLDDGLLDFTVLFGSTGQQAADLASDILSQGFSQAQGGVQLLRVPWLIVEADQDLKCNRDGEPSPASKRLVFEVIPRRINLHLPDTRLLVDGQPAAAAAAATRAGAVGGGSTTAAADRRRLSRSWSTNRKKALRIGSKPRPRLLLDLWKAQQPPGRLSRIIPKAKKLLGKTVLYGALLGAGIAVGMSLRSGAVSVYASEGLQQMPQEQAAANKRGPIKSCLRSGAVSVDALKGLQQMPQEQAAANKHGPINSWHVDMRSPEDLDNRNALIKFQAAQQQPVAVNPLQCQYSLKPQPVTRVRAVLQPSHRQSMPLRRSPDILHAKLL